MKHKDQLVEYMFHIVCVVRWLYHDQNMGQKCNLLGINTEILPSKSMVSNIVCTMAMIRDEDALFQPQDTSPMFILM